MRLGVVPIWTGPITKQTTTSLPITKQTTTSLRYSIAKPTL